MRQSFGIVHTIWCQMMDEARTWRGGLMIGLVCGAALARVIWRAMP